MTRRSANYGTQSIKKTHDVAMALMKSAYKKAPRYFYFVGFSQGGHEAINAAGLYPKDHDGVVAGTPSYNVAMMHAVDRVGVSRRAVLERRGRMAEPCQDAALLVKSVYATCDGLDGLKDGIISNTGACLDTFDVTQSCGAPTVRTPRRDACRTPRSQRPTPSRATTTSVSRSRATASRRERRSTTAAPTACSRSAVWISPHIRPAGRRPSSTRC